jgi:hypothetical protein
VQPTPTANDSCLRDQVASPRGRKKVTLKFTITGITKNMVAQLADFEPSGP